MCDFLLVINSNLGPILSHFRDIAGFLLRTVTPPLFDPNFGVFPWDQIVDVVAMRCEVPRLIIHVINFKLVQPISPQYVNVTDRWTDRQTDDLL